MFFAELVDGKVLGEDECLVGLADPGNGQFTGGPRGDLFLVERVAQAIVQAMIGNPVGGRIDGDGVGLVEQPPWPQSLAGLNGVRVERIAVADEEIGLAAK